MELGRANGNDPLQGSMRAPGAFTACVSLEWVVHAGDVRIHRCDAIHDGSLSNRRIFRGKYDVFHIHRRQLYGMDALALGALSPALSFLVEWSVSSGVRAR